MASMTKDLTKWNLETLTISGDTKAEIVKSQGQTDIPDQGDKEKVKLNSEIELVWNHQVCRLWVSITVVMPRRGIT